MQKTITEPFSGSSNLEYTDQGKGLHARTYTYYIPSKLCWYSIKIVALIARCLSNIDAPCTTDSHL